MNKEVGGFYLKPMFRLLVAMSIIAFAASIMAFSCDKRAPVVYNFSGISNSDGSSTNGSERTLSLEVVSNSSNFVKIKDNIAYISAAGLANKLTPLSKANDADRSFDDLRVANTAAGSGTSYLENVFNVVYHGTRAAMVFVNRVHITKDTIALRASNACTGDGEQNDNALAKAAGGGICRYYIAINTLIGLYNTLGTVFDNTKTTSHARGKMECVSALGNFVNGKFLTITDISRFNSINAAICNIGVVNNRLSTSTEINDAWVTDSGSTTEVELYAIAIDVSGKTISEFSSAPGFNRREFDKAMDNAAFKELLKKNPWAELKFKVKIVTAAAFAALP